MLASLDVREAFCKATTEKDEDTRNAMLGAFLSAMLAKAVPNARRVRCQRRGISQ